MIINIKEIKELKNKQIEVYDIMIENFYFDKIKKVIENIDECYNHHNGYISIKNRGIDIMVNLSKKTIYFFLDHECLNYEIISTIDFDIYGEDINFELIKCKIKDLLKIKLLLDKDK